MTSSCKKDKIRNSLLTLSHLITVTLLLQTCAFGQSGRAELSGSIQDPDGLLIPNAHIHAEQQTTMARFTGNTDERGAYHLLGLPPGPYVLRVEQPGFRTYQQSGIILRVGDHTIIDVRLEIGQPSLSLEVTAGAGLLQTSTGEVSFHLDETRIVALPLDGRNFVPLLALSPGVGSGPA